MTWPCEDGALIDATHLIVDWDSSVFPMRGFLHQNSETEVILQPPKNPNVNAYIKRWARSLKSECLDSMTFFSRNSLKNAVREFAEHSHAERDQQRHGNDLIEPSGGAVHVARRIECHERLGARLK